MPVAESILLPKQLDDKELDNGELLILLVEDNISDAVLTRIAIDHSRNPYKMHNIQTGDQVLPWLYQRFRDKKRMPDLILLDIGLPCHSGFEILNDLATSPSYIHNIPIVILTGYTDFDYLRKTYNLWIADYLVKPPTAQTIDVLLKRIAGKLRAD